MKSKTSFFNWGVSKNLLHRCWPVWAGYLALLLILWPLQMMNWVRSTVGYTGLLPMLDQQAVSLGEVMMIVAFAAAILVAMLMYSYLYNQRGCGMMNALPVTRTTMFFTAWLTGLTPLLLSDLLAAALCLPFVAQDNLSLQALGTLLGVTVLSNVAFYGFAVFCAMLTGSIVILPLVFLVLNFTAYVAELATRYVMSKVIFGLNPDTASLIWLSPLAQMLHSFGWTGMEEDRLVIRGLGTAALYGASGIAFTLIAWRLYLRRQMESATDTVAFPILKPMFKYCMAYGCGILFAAFCFSVMLSDQERGMPAAALTLLFVLIGSLIGYFIAEMLIQKTVWVFRGRWKGWLIFAAAAVLVIGACEFDLFGWERSLPDAEHVVSVMLDTTEYKEPDSIRAILALQESVTANKKKHENLPREELRSAMGLRIIYCMDSGRTLSRWYTLTASEADLHDADSDMAKLQAVCNLPEALRYRSLSKVEVKPENIMYFIADYSYLDEEYNQYTNDSVRFSPEEAVDFYQNALLADLAADTVGRRFLYDDGSLPRQSNVQLMLELWDAKALNAGAEDYRAHSWYSITVYEDNTAILQWLREHGDREIVFSDDPQPISYGTPDLLGG